MDRDLEVDAEINPFLLQAAFGLVHFITARETELEQKTGTKLVLGVLLCRT